MECLAIGSLPYNNPQDAIKVVEKYFSSIPFWPQLAKVSKNEDMTFQFLEGMPSFFISEDFKFNTEDEKFYKDLEQFFLDYEEIIENNNEDLLEKYSITEDFSSTFKPFLELAKNATLAKGQVVGPFTLATTLTDKGGRCAIYDDTLKEIIVKTLTLKALWQINQIKKVGATPIIFIDEPSISQLGTSAYLTISQDDVVEMLKEISDAIKSHGALSAIHCCGKCDWSAPIKTGINIISLDAFAYAQNLSIFHKDVEKFLKNGGKIAWGVVPTLDKEALENANLETVIDKFDKSVNYLTKKGINEKLIIENSYVTPSCGAGSLSIELAEKAMQLTKELSENLKARYNAN